MHEIELREAQSESVNSNQIERDLNDSFTSSVNVDESVILNPFETRLDSFFLNSPTSLFTH
jgi:hypothetical protein